MTILSKIFHFLAFPDFSFFPKDEEVGRVDPLSEDELSNRLRNKRALVVGGSSGIGRGIAEALASHGASVVVVGSSSTRCEAATNAMSSAAKFPADQEFRSFAADLSTVKGCVAVAKQLSGKFDYVVFTVGVWPDKECPRTTDGVDKVIALDVLARFAITEELGPLLSKDAKVMSVLGSGTRAPPAPSAEVMKQLMTCEKVSYYIPQMLGTAGVAMDNWLQNAPAHHPGISFIGTFPGIVGTSLVMTSKTFPSCLRPILLKLQSLVALSPQECAMNHLQVLVSANTMKRSTTYFNTVGLEGRKAHPLAYDADFGKWVWAFLEDRLTKLR